MIDACPPGNPAKLMCEILASTYLGGVDNAVARAGYAKAQSYWCQWKPFCASGGQLIDNTGEATNYGISYDPDWIEGVIE